MADSRQRSWNQVLGPRALAVISCALALLAAQPAGGAPGAVAQHSELRMKGGEVGGSGGVAFGGLEFSRISPETGGGTRARKELAAAPLGRTSRRVHVLATMEVMRRWLAYELRPMERNVVPALLLAPVSAGMLELPMTAPHRAEAAAGAGGRSAEQEFAMARLLLAPPIS